MKENKGGFLKGFLLGFIIAVVVLYGGFVLLIQNDFPGTLDERILFSDSIQNIRASLEADGLSEEEFIHGILTEKGANTLTVETEINDVLIQQELSVDEATIFYTFSQDEDSIEIPITFDDIAVGDTVTVFFDELEKGRAAEVLKL